MRSVLTAFALAMLAGGQAQTQQAPVIATTPKPSISFDVVSIKRNTTNSSDYAMPFPAAADGLVIRNNNLFFIIKFTYQFWSEDLIAGAPDWTKAERYDIVAKVAAADVPAWQALTNDQRRLMLQHILEERFKLKAHFEPKEITVHELVVAKGGPKMSPADPNAPNDLKNPDGTPVHGILYTGPGQYTAQSTSMKDLALTLSDYTSRQVIDRTGLTGVYDFKLQFTPEPGFGPEYRHRTSNSPPLPEFTGPSIYTAVQEQLGLKLEPAKAPVDSLVIDQIQRPEEN